MKKTLAFILAALLLASSVVSCGNGATKETEKNETNAIETNAPATEALQTDPVETDAPAPVYPYDTSLITENGVAKAHIVLPDGASADEQTAAEELRLHIQLVSGGAEVAVVNAAQSDSLPIIIGTPATVPELEALFPEDIEWLRTTEEINAEGKLKRWGTDGFAIRQKDGKLYIFGATAEGTLNGVYDFIEDNLGVIWVNTSEIGTVYDEMPTITTAKADYSVGHREKSPFEMRYAFGSKLLDQRNKHDTDTQVGGMCHNVKWLLTTSPTYDPNENEYWETHMDGSPLREGYQINYWSELTTNVIIDSVIAKLDAFSDADRPKYYPVCQEDLGFSSGVYPEMKEPFEYAPGQFVYPGDPAYISTVYFTFINKVTQKVNEKYPDVKITTLAYDISIIPPVCELDKNITIWFCPWYTDYSDDSFDETLAKNVTGDYDAFAIDYVNYYRNWVKQFPDNGIMIFDYYYTHTVAGIYERPIWYRVQNDFKEYAENGGLGTFSCFGPVDDSDVDHPGAGLGGPVNTFTNREAHAMNILSQWLFYKLTWNPYEDVDALIVYFCDKVYGDASEYMQEYYNIVRLGWKGSHEYRAEEFNGGMHIVSRRDYYFNFFLDIEVDGIHVYTAIQESLAKAWEAADDRAKEFIRRPYEVFADWEHYLY